MTPEERIKAQALAVGFDAARITTAEAPGHAEQAAAWLAAGMHGEMGYLKRRENLREGPASVPELLPGARSLILVALSYDFEAPETPSPPSPLPLRERGAFNAANPGFAREYGEPSLARSRGCFRDRHPSPAAGEGKGVRASGTVARYARGTDYHPLMWEKLKLLSDWIKETFGPDVQTRGFADSGPLRERELAARAGLGWQGKHTNLISLDLGNWFFIGVLLTTLPLRPDEPMTGGHCGTCTRCLTACPTGAIVAPQTLDARRCISYLTIEHRGPIAPELRPLMGSRIFGCDDCLAACPWNDRAQQAREMRLAARPGHDFPDLIEWLERLADEDWFKAEFAKTPLLRTKREGLRRNVCVALGNVGGGEAAAPLADALTNDPSPLVRGHAAWALGQIEQRAGDGAARQALVGAAERETDPEVREEITAALAPLPARFSGPGSEGSAGRGTLAR